MSDRWKTRLRLLNTVLLLGLALFFGWFHLWGALPKVLEWLELRWLTAVLVSLAVVLSFFLFRFPLRRIGAGLRSRLRRVWGWFWGKNEDIRLKLTELAVVVLIGVAGVWIVRLEISETAENAKDGRLAALFSGAVAQLGVDKSKEDADPPLATRVGALSTLHNLMEADPERYYWDVLKATAVYIRQNSRELCQNAGTETLPQPCSSPREDVESALTILRDHKWQRNRAPNGRGEHLDLHEAHLVRANLIGADLRGADLNGADLRDVNLEVVDLVGADLVGVNLVGADLRGASLAGVHLRGADLRGANLRGADLRGANLRGVSLRGAILWGAGLRDAESVTEKQLKQAYVDVDTTFPDGKKRDCAQLFEEGWPIHWRDRTCDKEDADEDGYRRKNPNAVE